MIDTLHFDRFELRRQKMVEKLGQMGIYSQQVLAAMATVPRHLFVEDALRSRAYDNVALPIGAGQTISQPYMVAKMSQLLLAGNRPVQKILEIGTGCGYQTAILETLGILEIYSLERIFKLRTLAISNLRQAHLFRSRLICEDGYLGLPSKAPFDAILLTAAPSNIPISLLEQLENDGGRMVIPLGEKDRQYLWVIDKYPHGYQETCIEAVNFVLLKEGRQ